MPTERCSMTTVTMTELKNKLREYLRMATQGEEVWIKNKGKFVAKIVSFELTEDPELLSLAAEGKINLSTDTTPLSEDFFKQKLPRVGVDLKAMLREERDER